MIKPYGPSQPPTPGCGIQTLPAFCHKERFLSYKKKGEGKRGGGWCKQVLPTNAAPCLQVPTPFPCARLGEATWEGKSGVSPQPPVTPLGSQGSESSWLWGPSMRWVGAAERPPRGLTPAGVGRLWISCLD